MFTLKLDAKQCVCCGICMDVCVPEAVGMRTRRGYMTFPHMAHADRCDGCLVGVDECPVAALALQQAGRVDNPTACMTYKTAAWTRGRSSRPTS